MKSLSLNLTSGGIWLLAVTGLIFIANPGQNDYEDYATEKLSSYLKDKICYQANQQLGNFLQSQCKNLIDTSKPQIEELIAHKTKRQNFLLFSIYQTELSISQPLPSYYFETLGGFGQFYTYKAEES